MPVPTNLSALTATDIGTSLPTTITQDVHEAGTTYTVWYRYTAQVGDEALGLFGLGSADLVTYRPTVSTYIGPASSPVALSISVQNKPIQVAVTPGEIYYFQFFKGAGNPSPAVLTLNVQRHAPELAPAESIVQNDTATTNQDSYPLVIASHTTDYDVLKFVPAMPAGDRCDCLANGIMLFKDWNIGVSASQRLKLLRPDFTLIAAIGVGASTENVGIRACRGTGRFWVAESTNPVSMRSISDTGTLGTVHNITGTTVMNAFAVNNDETILYHTTSSGAAAVQRWDLVNDVALSDFIAGAANWLPGGHAGMLVLSDDTVLVAFRRDSPSIDHEVRRYNAAGTLLNTYTFTGTGGVWSPKICYAGLASPLAFWVHLPESALGTGVMVWQKIRVSDGVVLFNRPHMTFTAGTYAGTETATPLTRFGVPSPGQFFVLPGAFGSVSGITTEPKIIRRLRRFPVISEENLRVLFPNLVVDFQPGEGITTGQGSDPEAVLRFSNDGGRTWSNQRVLKLGKMGAYGARVIARRLGQSRNRVYEIVVSDPIFASLLAAYHDPQRGTS